jgi:hypothetical protein
MVPPWAITRDDRPWNSNDPPAAVYNYAPGRGPAHANALLGSYRRILQCDDYGSPDTPLRVVTLLKFVYLFFPLGNKSTVNIISIPPHFTWIGAQDLNQIETWLSILSGKSLKDASFGNMAELKEYTTLHRQLQRGYEAIRLDKEQGSSEASQTMFHGPTLLGTNSMAC